MVLPGRVRQVPPPRNRPKRIVPRLVSVGRRGIRPADDCDGSGRFDDFMIRRLWLALHSLDAHLCGRCRNGHIRRRRRMAAVAQGNRSRRHNQQRRSADSHYLQSIHRASHNPHNAISNGQACAVKLIQNALPLSDLSHIPLFLSIQIASRACITLPAIISAF